MRKLFTTLLTIAIVAVVTGLTEANTVKQKDVKIENCISKSDYVYIANDFTILTFAPILVVEKRHSRKVTFDICGYQNGVYYCCYMGGSAVHCYAAPPPKATN